MTDKRFYIDNDGDLYDRQTKRLLMLDFGYSEAIYVNAVLELLNNLHEENIQLKHDKQQLYRTESRLRVRIKELEKELSNG